MKRLLAYLFLVLVLTFSLQSGIKADDNGKYISKKKQSSYITKKKDSSYITKKKDSNYITKKKQSSYITKKKQGSYIIKKSKYITKKENKKKNFKFLLLVPFGFMII